MKFNQLHEKSFRYGLITIIIIVGSIIFSINQLINLPVKEVEERERIKRVKFQTGVDESAFSNFPLVLGRREGCLLCHNNVLGSEASHNPGIIGCWSCHLGNRLTKDKTEAHKDMVLIPGNISNASKICGTTGCHPQMIPKMQNSIMNSMNGVVSVDKWVFMELSSPTFKTPVDSISYSPADTHLRNLCASCHLSNEKTGWSPVNELTRGGGCLACHLNYSKEAEKDLESYRKSKKENFIHPQLSIKVSNDHCFGCHSRSGRISLSYDGWYETMLKPEEVKGNPGYRILADGRVAGRKEPDIHSEKGMLCIDCHNSYEIMGDGSYALHKENQVKIQCTDCHLISEPFTFKSVQFDFESEKTALIAGLLDMKRNYLSVTKINSPVVNSFYEDKKAYIIKKSSGETVEVKPPAPVCTSGSAHKSLSCNSCHSSWTPQCIGCHTEFNKNGTMYDLLANKESKGEWLEYPKDYLVEPAVLGIREIRADGKIKRSVEEFIPGMVLTVTSGSKHNGTIFKRLYAPAFSHTIRKQARSCVSCHNNPAALGYGRGKLEYRVTGNSGRWIFTSQYTLVKNDGLPGDAWIGFLKEKGNNSTTRDNTRSFSVEEQKRILTVGACLTCHKQDSGIITKSLIDFNFVFLRRSKNCKIPDWKLN